MLKKINLTNYTTFIKETEIDFMATNAKLLKETNVQDKILKGCLFVGKNGTGKSNILKSIVFLFDMLFTNENDLGIKKSLYTDIENYKLEYVFFIDNKDITYCIEIGNNKIITEKLMINTRAVIERMGKSGKSYIKGEELYEGLSDNQLLIKRIYSENKFHKDEILIKWRQFLVNSIYINSYNRIIKGHFIDKINIQKYLKKNSPTIINNFLKEIGYDQQISYKNKFFKEKTSLVFFNHKNYNFNIGESEEATGNLMLLNLIPSFIFVTKNEGMIILDNFSMVFHNDLEEKFLKYFFKHAKNSQIFFTTHSTNILDNSVIRPDQVYAVSFKSKTGSAIKRFSDELPRDSQNLEKMYLDGAFESK